MDTTKLQTWMKVEGSSISYIPYTFYWGGEEWFSCFPSSSSSSSSSSFIWRLAGMTDGRVCCRWSEEEEEGDSGMICPCVRGWCVVGVSLGEIWGEVADRGCSCDITVSFCLMGVWVEEEEGRILVGKGCAEDILEGGLLTSWWSWWSSLFFPFRRIRVWTSVNLINALVRSFSKTSWRVWIWRSFSSTRPRKWWFSRRIREWSAWSEWRCWSISSWVRRNRVNSSRWLVV